MTSKIDRLSEEIALLRQDIQSILYSEQEYGNNQNHLSERVKFLNPLKEREIAIASDSLKREMVQDCQVKEKCYQVFMDFLRQVNDLIIEETISEQLINAYQERILSIQKNPRFETCPICFAEINRLFEQHVSLLKALNVCDNTGIELKDSSVSISDFVSSILDPLSNEQRFIIVQAVSNSPKSYSELSQLTKLRGGNLLFHINKLEEKNLIVQRCDRGDYLITPRGKIVLEKFLDLADQLTREKEIIRKNP
jgi:DNA-binding transcriptional ArsR family regulator